MAKKKNYELGKSELESKHTSLIEEEEVNKEKSLIDKKLPDALLATCPFYFTEMYDNNTFNKFYVSAGDIITEPRHIKALLSSAHIGKFKIIEDGDFN